MEIEKLKLTKEGLASLPQSDRSLLLLLGNTANEIILLQKLMVVMRQTERHPEHFVNLTNDAQVLVIMRMLIGKLHEAWRLIKERVQADQELRGYLTHLGQEGTTALDRLNTHFGAQSPLTSIRNKLSFHNADRDNLIEASFQKLTADEPWDFYIGTTMGNSFYYASELVTTHATIELTKAGNEIDGFAKLWTLVAKTAYDLLQLYVSLIIAILEKWLPNRTSDLVEIASVRSFASLDLPFFAYPHDA